MNDVKQVIVIRKDLRMRRGKECSMAGHAAIAWLHQKLVCYDGSGHQMLGIINEYDFSEAEFLWLTGMQKKVCVQVDSEEELLGLYHKALEARIVAHLIRDAGLTEFHGTPTLTALAIGPDYSEKIDPITKDLKLY